MAKKQEKNLAGMSHEDFMDEFYSGGGFLNNEETPAKEPVPEPEKEWPIKAEEDGPGERKEGAKRGRRKKEVEGVGTHVVYLPDQAYFALQMYKARRYSRDGFFSPLGSLLAEATFDMIRRKDKELYEVLEKSALHNSK